MLQSGGKQTAPLWHWLVVYVCIIKQLDYGASSNMPASWQAEDEGNEVWKFIDGWHTQKRTGDSGCWDQIAEVAATTISPAMTKVQLSGHVNLRERCHNY